VARPFSVWRVQRQSNAFRRDIYSGGKRSTIQIDTLRKLYQNLQNLVLESFLDSIAVFECGEATLVIPHAQIVRNQMLDCNRVQNNSYYVPQQHL
jgi:hypothetical protein